MPTQEYGPPSGMPSASERGEMIRRLALKGLTSQDLANAITSGKTRQEIMNAIIALQRAAPKAT